MVEESVGIHAARRSGWKGEASMQKGGGGWEVVEDDVAEGPRSLREGGQSPRGESSEDSVDRGPWR